jgi:GNAT superfamily N-acetyltransferase
MTIKVPLALSHPPHNLTFRPISTVDVTTLPVRLWPEHPPDLKSQMLERTMQNARRGRGIGVVLTDTGSVNAIAFGQLTFWPACAEIADLIVHHNLRGRGYGTALIQHLTGRAVARGMTVIEIGAALSNSRALQLYRRLGFEDARRAMLRLNTRTEETEEEVLYLQLIVTP